jgi:hypothetical protein
VSAAACVLLAGCIVGSDDPETSPGTLAATWGPYDPKPGHPTEAERDAFVTEISQYAREAEQMYGTPAADVTAMACNESGFGWTKIALNANNLFGWKWYSAETAGGRPPWTLVDQPASDPGNQYVTFSDRRDAVLFVAQKLASNTRYKPHTDRYVSDIGSGVDVKTAADRWIYGVAYAGYNPFEHYPVTTIKFMNNYRTPSATRSPAYDLYRYSPATHPVWVSIDAPANGGTVSGDVALVSNTGGDTITSVRFASRAQGATDWYALGEATTAPFTRTWATDPWVSNGTYELKAEAYTGTTLRATGIITVAVANP